MDRPKSTDDYIAKAAAEDLLPRLMQWAEAGESERANYLADAVDIMRGAGYRNAYELARELERHGYEPDARLVEILDDAWFLIRERHHAAVKEWVKGWKIQVPWIVGQAVRVKRQGKEVTGEVISIEPEEAVCIVHCPELGHGLVVNSEDVLPELVTV